MRIGYLVFNLDGMGGTSRSAITQANALAGDHHVTLLSVTRQGDKPHYEIDERIEVRYLVDAREDHEPSVPGLELTPARAQALHESESLLVPHRWDHQFTALCDVGLERALPGIRLDVLVTVTPGLLAAAIQLLPPEPVVVHQEHRSTSDRSSGLEPFLIFAPRADVVAVFTPAMADWVREQLGDSTPELAIVPNPLPLGFTPRSRLDNPLIVTAGRLVNEKQYNRLIESFAQVADQIPQWRLRIFGTGPKRIELVRLVRKLGAYDRVELPGAAADMRGEWAKASIHALTSRAEAFPLTVQEAMAAGVPVASYDCASGPREIIQHEVNGLLVAPESIAGMSAALLRLATDVELRRSLGEGAFRTSRQYDAYAIAERWVGIFSAARSRRTTPGRLASKAAAPAGAKRAAPSPAERAVAAVGVTPGEARHIALDWVVQTAAASSDQWLVIPSHESDSPVVVVPMSDRDAFLESLGGLGAPTYLSLRDPAGYGWPERRDAIAFLADDLRRGMTPRLFVEPWPEVDGRSSLVGQGCSVEVQFWERHVDGSLMSPRPNRYTNKIPPGSATVPLVVDGVEVPTLPLMATPTINECRFPVDVVYTWVDGSDPEWDAAREQRIATIEGPGSLTARTREASGRARFLSRDELRYSLRSVDLFAPWVRNIYLVTSGQVPEWLDLDHPGVQVVPHSEIMPPESLPTFNSHAIETSLHHIPGLAEHWLYFNDDFFLGRPIRPEALFSPAGLSSVFFAPSTIGLSDSPDAAPWLKAAWNNRRLLEEAFGVVTTNALAHAPYALRTSVLGDIERQFAEVSATARSPFRSDTDISTLSSFAQHYGLMTGTAYAAEADTVFVNIANPDLDWQLSQLLRRDQDFFCLGDHHDHGFNQAKLDKLLTDFLREYFPVAAPWEKE